VRSRSDNRVDLILELKSGPLQNELILIHFDFLSFTRARATRPWQTEEGAVGKPTPQTPRFSAAPESPPSISPPEKCWRRHHLVFEFVFIHFLFQKKFARML
jgi:hypothetical protein